MGDVRIFKLPIAHLSASSGKEAQMLPPESDRGDGTVYSSRGGTDETARDGTGNDIPTCIGS